MFRAEDIPAMIEELRGIHKACAETSGELGTKWLADEANLIEEIIKTGSARQMYDAIQMFHNYSDYAGKASVMELENILRPIAR